MSENQSCNPKKCCCSAVCLALGLIISSFIIAGAASKIILKDQSILVKGYAETQITADRAQWSASFAVNSPNLSSAYDGLKQNLEKVIRFLEKSGVPRSTIEIMPVSTSFRYKKNEKGYATNELEAYVLDQSIRVGSDDVKLIDRISKTSTELIQNGIAIRSSHPQYFYTRLNDLKISLLGKAMKNALERARQLASSTGSEVGALKSASQGVFQITPPNSTDVSNYGTYDTSSIEKAVKAVVTVRYYVD